MVPEIVNFPFLRIQLPAAINQIFDILDLLVVRGLLLALAMIGAYAVVASHRRRRRQRRELPQEHDLNAGAK